MSRFAPANITKCLPDCHRIITTRLTRLAYSCRERTEAAMAGLGLFLIRVVCWASELLWRTPRRPRDFALVFAAHAAMAGVTVIGFVVDHLPMDTTADRPIHPFSSRRRMSLN